MGSVINFEQARMERVIPEIDTGFIKLYRSLEECSFYKDLNKKSVWIHMLLKATHKPYKTIMGGQTVELQTGQFATGLRKLADESGVSFQSLRTSLEFFEREGMIRKEKVGNDGTVITVLKYAEYQGQNTLNFNTPSTHETNTPDNTLKASNGDDSEQSATHQSTPEQHTEPTHIQEYNNISIPNGIECPEQGSEPEDSKSQKAKNPNCPHKELLALWEEIIPETVQHNPQTWKSGRAGYTNLAKRWKAGFVTQKSDGSGVLYNDLETGLAWWKRLFQYLRKSDFLINDCKPFCLEWTVKPANYNKIVEGNYHA